MPVWKCEKCSKTFDNKKKYIAHLNRDVPCDYTCRICGKQYSKAGYYKHRKSAHPTSQHNPQLVIDSSTHTASANSNNTLQSNTTNNLNNMVMMVPFGLEHRTTLNTPQGREELIGGSRDLILNLVRNGEFEKAYEVLFKQIHGNTLLPQYHNIYMDNNEDHNICAFKGRYFKLESVDVLGDKLLHFLRREMQWLVFTAQIEFDEKDQLIANILHDWRRIDTKQDPTVKRMLRNNKPVVENTFQKNEVWPDLKAIAKYYDFPVDVIPHDGVPLKMTN